MAKRSVSPGDRSASRSPKRPRDLADSDGSHDDRRRLRDRSESRDGGSSRSRDGGSRGAPERRRSSPSPAAPVPAAAPVAPRERKPAVAGPAGGVYIPPFKLAQMMAEVADKEGPQYQRMTWDALRKSLNGLVNKVNAANIKHVLPEFFQENMVRGRGLLCRSLMKSQMASPAFTPVYAALVAVINTKFPEFGELLLHRVVTQFKRAYKRNDKPVCLAALTFVAHLVNQQVVHEVLALEVALLLLETPSDDGVEVAASFMRECGAMLQDLSPTGVTYVFDRLRAILHEGSQVSARTQYIIEGLYAVRKAGFEASGHPAVPPELDLVDTADQITHELNLEEKLDPQMHLDVFKEDPEFAAHEEEYAAIRREILGEESEEEGDSEGSSDEEEEDEEEEEGAGQQRQGGGGAGGPIHDETGTDLVNLRRTIYLTIMSALDYEEAGHKLLKMGIPEGMENELATMIIECCSQEKTFIKYYAMLGERFCKLNRAYADCFAECFVAQYRLIHRLETNKLRNVAKLFAHLLATDALSWAVLAAVRLTEEDTTSSSRIFIKILFQELAEIMGLASLNARLGDPVCAGWFGGVFPQDSPRNMRFAINFFTSIGLGGLTDRMRDTLKNLPRLIAERQKAEAEARAAQGKDASTTTSGSTSSTSSGSDSDDSSSSSGSSDSDDSSSSGSDTTSSSSGGSSSSSDSDSDSDSGSDSGRRGGRRRGRKGGRSDSDSGRDRQGGRGRVEHRQRSEPRRPAASPRRASR